AAIAEARLSLPLARAKPGSATVTANASPSPCRKAMARARPAKPPPAISTSLRCGGEVMVAVRAELQRGSLCISRLVELATRSANAAFWAMVQTRIDDYA